MRRKANNMNMSKLANAVVVDGSRATLRSMTGKRLALAGLAMCTMILSSPRACAATGPIVDVDPSNQTWNEDHGNGMVGWTFTLRAPLTVTAVGWYDDGQDGLSRPFQVGLWQDLSGNFNPGSNPQQLLGTPSQGMIIPGGTTASLQGSWRVVPLSSPLTLDPGNYELGGLDTATTSDTMKYVGVGGMFPYPPVWPGLSIGQFFYAYHIFPSTTFQVTYNDRFYLANGLELGPMLFAEVPEPCSISLLGLWAVMLLLVWWRRLRQRLVRCG
jgi:hypothetical protein